MKDPTTLLLLLNIEGLEAFMSINGLLWNKESPRAFFMSLMQPEKKQIF